MNLEKTLSRILKQKLTCDFNGSDWKRLSKLREEVKELYEKSDLTAGEICDFLEIRMDTLAEVLGAPKKPVRGDVWKQNFDQGLPLFVPVRLKGI